MDKDFLEYLIWSGEIDEVDAWKIEKEQKYYLYEDFNNKDFSYLTSSRKRGWRYNCEDGSAYNLFPKDFKTKKEYENALTQANEKALLAEKKELRKLGVRMGKLVWLNILAATVCFIVGCLSLSSEDFYGSAYIIFTCAILNMLFVPLSLKKSKELLIEKSTMSTIKASEWLTFQVSAAVSCLIACVILLIVLHSF